MAISTLKKAKEVKNDEFYTRLEDIEAEISMHPDYVRQFKDKVVFCNCDDPEWSNFHLFFRQHAIYNGSWVTNAKRYFSRVDGEGYASEGRVSNGHVYSDYLKVSGGKNSEKEDSVVRQRLLEIVLNWATDAYNKEQKLDKKEFYSLEGYMSLHRNDTDAKPLWEYFEEVMEWVKTTFPTYYDFMKGVEWGYLYNAYHNNTPANADQKVKDIVALAGIKDSEITNISASFIE